MKITATTLQMSASHASSTQREIDERLRVWHGDRVGINAGGTTRGNHSPEALDTARISEASKTRQISDTNAAASDDPLLVLLKYFIEVITGRPVKVFDASELGAAPADAPPLEEPDQAAGVGLEYERNEWYRETETTRFTASGKVRTGDGQEIDFSIELAMGRSYVEASDLHLRLGAAAKKDPLVINFAGHAAELSNRRFRLDVDLDGAIDEAHFPAAGSGFLVFDRNADGQVNGGKELFGPLTGDGFAELALLDNDHNGWVDAADEHFAGLRLWTRSADGDDHLATLAEAGIGALGLHHLATPFELKDGGNRPLGEVRSSGVYLREDGGGGTIQQIDLRV